MFMNSDPGKIMMSPGTKALPVASDDDGGQILTRIWGDDWVVGRSDFADDAFVLVPDNTSPLLSDDEMRCSSATFRPEPYAESVVDDPWPSFDCDDLSAHLFRVEIVAADLLIA